MRFKKTIALAVALWGTCSAVEAQDETYFYVTGNQMQDVCSKSMAACASYVRGVVDATEFQFDIADIAAKKPKRDLMCFPASFDFSQATAIFTKFLNDNPNIRHFTAPSLVLMSLGEFACEQPEGENE